MHRYIINFRRSARDRAGQIRARAYTQYTRLQPIVQKMYNPLREMHNKYAPWKKK